MLYSPKWSENLNDFLAWVEQQPANEPYNWANSQNCACGQYAKAIGKEEWILQALKGVSFWQMANALALGEPGDPLRWTFGALATRIHEHLRKQ